MPDRPARPAVALAGALAACCLAGTAAAVPAAAPPATGLAGGPPPAWVETAAGDRWLAFGSSCWRTGDLGLCADIAWPSAVPTIAVTRGERVRFHLGVAPTTVVMLRTGMQGRRLRGGASFRLSPFEPTVWTVRGRTGIAMLSLEAAQGQAAHVARFVLR